MALSPQDQAFYEERLSTKNMYWLVGATMLVGGIMLPILVYIRDSSNGLSAQWTGNLAFDWSMIGFMIGSIVGVFMYLAFKFLLAMGWLPTRR